ncbi:RusA family crossover junction endodeoxyribonuclease [Desulfovibrio falkowii]|uniref:RusA family crossover junction endodeoxyribonuclease n=1 Tax=Desulfovibrio sp. WGS1351 TaxID=3366814 RepID=UPI00372D3F80
MKDLTLTLPFPPSVNHYWRHVTLPLGKGKKGFRVQTLISADGRKYKESVCQEVLRQRIVLGITAPVMMSVLLCPPDRRRRDVDNYAKALLDSLVEAKVLKDDSQIRDLRLVWADAMPGGKAVVSIRSMAVPPAQGKLI